MRVIVLNNFDLERVRREIASGDKPAHHLFGLDALAAAGCELAIVPQGAGPRWLSWVGRLCHAVRWPVPLGDLGQQWRAWRLARQGDVIYAPCQTQTHVLGYLRAIGLLRTPHVALAHHPPITGRLAWLRRPFFRWQARGTDRFPALSANVAREIEALGPGRADYATVVRYGPDLAYYDRFVTEGPGDGAVSAGRTGRDWLTFGLGATRAGTPARIFCLARNVRPEFAAFGANVRVIAGNDESDLPYPRLLPELARARVLAVPLAPGPALAGLTSVTDALGLGKPIAVTRHPMLDLDVEREGVGRWVEPGDIEGWAATLHWFETHPEEAMAMGRRARALAEARWNNRAFGAEIVAILESVAR